MEPFRGPSFQVKGVNADSMRGYVDPLLYEPPGAEMLDAADTNDDRSVSQLVQFVQRSSDAGPPTAQ